MRALIVAAVAALGLAACNNAADGAKQALLQKCVSEGNSQQMCACVVDKFAAALPPEQLAIMAKGEAATPQEQQMLASNPQAAAAAMQAFSCAAMDPTLQGKAPF